MTRSLINNQSSEPAEMTARSVSRRKSFLRRNIEIQRASRIFYASLMCLFLGVSIQLASGASLVPAFLIFGGTLLGWLAAVYAGKKSTAISLILFWFALKTTGIALLCKSLVFEPWDSQVEYPFSTALVYFLGYAGLLAAVIFYGKCSWKTSRPIAVSAFQWRTAAVILFLPAVLLPSLVGDRVGGLWGALKIYAVVGNAVCVACAVNASIIENPKRILWHPLALCLLAVLMVVAVINTGKEAFVTPIIAYFVPLLISRRIGLLKISSVAVVIMFLITCIIGPYSDTIRFTGVRELSGESRIAATLTAFKSMFDSSARAEAKAEVETFRNREDAVQMMNGDWAYFDRLMMISGGKELIRAVDASGVPGMRLFWGDLSLMLPRMIAPWKSDVSSNYELARYSGMVPESINEEVGISFGPFPTYYAMGGYAGVFILGICLNCFLFFSIGWMEGHYSGRWIGGLIFLLVWHSFPEAGIPLDNMYKLLFLVLTLRLSRAIETLKTPRGKMARSS